MSCGGFLWRIKARASLRWLQSVDRACPKKAYFVKIDLGTGWGASPTSVPDLLSPRTTSGKTQKDQLCILLNPKTKIRPLVIPCQSQWAISMATASKTLPRPTWVLGPCPSCWGMVLAIFSPPTDFTVGVQPESVAVGDFNGDGEQDLAVANGASDNVSILLRDYSSGQINSPGERLVASSCPAPLRFFGSVPVRS